MNRADFERADNGPVSFDEDRSRAELEADNARLRDLVAKFQRGEPSDKFEKHGA